MAFNSTGLALVADGLAGGPRIWSYTSTDVSTVVAGTGYFAGQGQGSPNGSPAGMALGDLVLVWESTSGATPGRATLHGVAGSSANSTDTIHSSTWGYDISVASSAA